MNVIELCSLIEDGHCGYCQKRGKTSLGEEEDEETGKSVSLGIWAHYLTTSAYQELLDCGMRRSGLYVYKPIMERTCCPQYTIRLDTSKFFLSRNQKRCLRLMLDYLKNGVKPKCGPVQEMDIDQPTKITEKTEERNSTKTEAPSTKDSAERLSTKKKEKRRERCYEKWRSKGFNVQEMQDERERKEKARRRTTESYLEPHNNSWKHNLKVKLVKTDSVEFEERREESFLLFKKYQITIHQDKDVSEAGYKRFLVSDPFEKNRSRDSVPQFGAYHQWYILDEKLIAVGVIDILPHCLSSKYMYYDPDFNFLSLGTYTALREIEFTKKLSAIRPALKYYYMGYYIQSCPKMRYKGKFQPSELLCDKSFEWVPLSECQKMFAVVDSPYVTFRPNNLAPRKTIQDLTLLVKQRPIKYSDLPSIIPGFKSKESQKVHSNLTLLASLLPALPLRQNFLIFVGEIQRLASEEEDDSSDSNDE